MEPMTFNEYLAAQAEYKNYLKSFETGEPADVTPEPQEPEVVPQAPAAQEPVAAPQNINAEPNTDLEELKAIIAAQGAQIEQLKLMSAPSLGEVKPKGIEDIARKILNVKEG